MTVFNPFRIFNMPDAVEGDSLISSPSVEKNANAAGQQNADGDANQNADASQNGNNAADPFGDLKEFQDESGKYLGKYSSLRDVFEGYKNATAKLRERFPEPPESADKYEFTFQDEALKELDLKEDPVWKEMAPVFHEAKVSNETAQKIVEGFLKQQAAQRVKPEQIREGLGNEADRIVSEVQAFVNKAKDPDGVGMLGVLAGQNPQTLKAFHALIQQLGEKAIPKSAGLTSNKSWQELEAEAFEYHNKHKDTIDSNPAQQKIYEDLLRKAIQAKN